MNNKRYHLVTLLLAAAFMSSGCANADYKFETITWGYGSGDGRGMEAKFAYPHGIAVDQQGNLFVADRRNKRIRKITPEGVVTTFAGRDRKPGEPRFRDGLRQEAVFIAPESLALDEDGNLYVGDRFAIRKIVMDEENGDRVVTVAGVPDKRGHVDDKGSEARFRSVKGFSMDPDGNLLVADLSNRVVRRVTPEGEVSTVAGVPQDRLGQFETPVDGPADETRFGLIQDLCVAPDGTIYLTHIGPGAVRKIDPDGNVKTLAGRESIGLPKGICLDHKGNLLVVNDLQRSIVRITPEGELETIAGYMYDNAFVIFRRGRDSGLIRRARFASPHSITIDDNGVLYITDVGEHAIRVGRPR